MKKNTKFQEKLPWIILYIFQDFLIIDKIWNAEPFGHLSWYVILIPSFSKIIYDIIYFDESDLK